MITSTLGQRIKAFRENERIGLTQDEFANKINVHKQGLSKYERDANEPKSGVVSKIADMFPEVNLRWLLTGQGEMFFDAVAEAHENQTSSIGYTKQLNQALEVLQSETSAANFLKGQIEIALQMMKDQEELARAREKTKENGTDSQGR